jgi:hypothetical protein
MSQNPSARLPGCKVLCLICTSPLRARLYSCKKSFSLMAPGQRSREAFFLSQARSSACYGLWLPPPTLISLFPAEMEGPIPAKGPDAGGDGMRWRGGSSATASSTPCELVPSPGSSPMRMRPASPSSQASVRAPPSHGSGAAGRRAPFLFWRGWAGSGSSRHQAREIRRPRQACELVLRRHWRAPARPWSQERAGLGSW